MILLFRGGARPRQLRRYVAYSVGLRMGLFSVLKARLNATRNPDLKVEEKWIVAVSDDRISCTRPSGKIESLEWADLQVVAIETTDQGPFAADVFWYLAGETSGCVVPLGATGEPALVELLQTLPGFDNEALIKAMSSTSNQRFILWRKNDAT